MGKNYNSARNGVQRAPTGKTQLEESGPKLESTSNAHSSFSAGTHSAPQSPNLVVHSMSNPSENKFALFFSQLVNMVKHGSYVITLIVMMVRLVTLINKPKPLTLSFFRPGPSLTTRGCLSFCFWLRASFGWRQTRDKFACDRLQWWWPMQLCCLLANTCTVSIWPTKSCPFQ